MDKVFDNDNYMEYNLLFIDLFNPNYQSKIWIQDFKNVDKTFINRIQ